MRKKFNININQIYRINVVYGGIFQFSYYLVRMGQIIYYRLVFVRLFVRLVYLVRYNMDRIVMFIKIVIQKIYDGDVIEKYNYVFIQFEKLFIFRVLKLNRVFRIVQSKYYIVFL